MRRSVYVNDGDLTPFYQKNKVSNTKYTVFNFIPKNLMEQFSRFMNKYFLLVAFLQLWPLITPVNPASTWGPLFLIFSVTAMKEGWDDYSRFLMDKQANSKAVWVVKHGTRSRVKSQDICVGDIVWLRENDEVPCDLVLLATSESSGFCYVETAAIDGETNLKTRAVPRPCTGILAADLLLKIKGVIECPVPDKDIDNFDATMRLFPPFIDTELAPLTSNNLLLQSCHLRNTDWVCGVAVYTGNETKLGMSRGVTPTKVAYVDRMIDQLTAAIFCFQLVVVVILGAGGNLWRRLEVHKLWYIEYPVKRPWYETLVIPLRFELLCSIMIPISLKVTMDLLKGLYSKFIDWDLRMYDQDTDTPALASNTGIPEDLGQVEYILTDKTGTLTENLMLFKQCIVKGVSYGTQERTALEDPELAHALSEGGLSSSVAEFFKVLALCNTVVPAKVNGEVVWKAASQDENALVEAAARMGVVLFSKQGERLCLNFLGRVVEYEVLEELEFTSERRRMSVIVREAGVKTIRLYLKGADDIVFQRLNPDQPTRATIDAIEGYATHGLRTLCIAWRELSEEEYASWAETYSEAKTALQDREWKMAEACEAIEKDLELLGATAIEDKLQEGVPETIDILRQAGINFWMLTGDKYTTAVQIALACNFIAPEPEGQLLRVEGSTAADVSHSLDRVLQTMRISGNQHKEVAMVIEGRVLEVALKYHAAAFAELCSLSRTAICCRVTPSQKAELVRIVKAAGLRTLAIGDGGNDVRMIQEAHVGVGISGREGLQAARAADMSIGKFRFLQRLVLVHGRYSYHRTAFVAQYSIYKSLLLCFIQIFFSFFTGMAGTSLFNSFSLMAYNVLYTSFPVLAYVLDKDISPRTVLAHPRVLTICHASKLLNPSTFAGWFGRSIYQAAVILAVSLGSYRREKGDLEEVSLVVFSACIWVQVLTVALETNSFTVYQHLSLWGTVAAFYGVNLLLGTVVWGGEYHIMSRLCSHTSYWLAQLLAIVAAMAPVLALKYFRFTYRPSILALLQRVERADSWFNVPFDLRKLSSMSFSAPAEHPSPSVSGARGELLPMLTAPLLKKYADEEREAGLAASVPAFVPQSESVEISAGKRVGAGSSRRTKHVIERKR